MAGSLADRGMIKEAIDLLLPAVSRVVRKPLDRHLRQWYTIADLYERSGDLPRTAYFMKVVAADPEMSNVVERLGRVALSCVGLARMRGASSLTCDAVDECREGALEGTGTSQTEHVMTSRRATVAADIYQLLGEEAESLLGYSTKAIPKEQLELPGPRLHRPGLPRRDRSPQVLRSLQAMFGHGRLAGTGYLSILPVDQGIEHSAGASFAKNPIYFDRENIVKLAHRRRLQRRRDHVRRPRRACRASTRTGSRSS